MSSKLEKLAATLTITMILLSLAFVNVKTVFSAEIGGRIDLYTQQYPYNGEGVNVPSDAFAPGDIVVLYSLVTYNEVPLQEYGVAFHVQSSDNSSFTLTGRTDEGGIATVNFTIPHKCENTTEVFGEWVTIASVSIDGNIVQDTLTFRVDWIVKLLSVKTLDENLTYRNMFGIGGDVGLEVTLRNIAMTSKNATIAMVVLDESKVPVSSFSIHDFEVQPNEKTVIIYFRLFLPKWSRVGKASVFVCALTAPAEYGGVPYCPEVSTEFYILIRDPLAISFHDASIVKMVPSSTSVKRGEPVYVTVTVRNEGTSIENFTVNTYYDNILITTVEVTELSPYTSMTLNLTFNTSPVNPGNYTMAAFIPYLASEADYSDNLVEEVIEIRPARQYYLTVQTDPLDIVLIPGEGWHDEDANITLVAPEYVSVSAGVRYRFSDWDVDGTPQLDNSIIVTMNANHTATAHYILQYYLTVVSSYGTKGGEGWYDVNTTAYATLDTSIVDHGNNTRRVFTSWSGDASGVHFMQSSGIFMDRPKTAIAVWRTQYYLVVRTEPSGIVTIEGEGWYSQLENVTLTAPTVEGYDFDHWDIDGTFQGAGVNTITFFMNAPHTATAHYSIRVSGWYIPWWSLFWYLLFPLLLILILLFALLYRRRRRKEKEKTFYRGWTAWYYQYNLRKKT